VRTGKHQEVHFQTIIIKLWKTLPQDVMEAKSVKGFQKGIRQFNGRESHQRLLKMTSWPHHLAWEVSVLLTARARRRPIREWSFMLRLWLSIWCWSLSEAEYWERWSFDVTPSACSLFYSWIPIPSLIQVNFLHV